MMLPTGTLGTDSHPHTRTPPPGSGYTLTFPMSSGRRYQPQNSRPNLTERQRTRDLRGGSPYLSTRTPGSGAKATNNGTASPFLTEPQPPPPQQAPGAEASAPRTKQGCVQVCKGRGGGLVPRAPGGGQVSTSSSTQEPWPQSCVDKPLRKTPPRKQRQL